MSEVGGIAATIAAWTMIFMTFAYGCTGLIVSWSVGRVSVLGAERSPHACLPPCVVCVASERVRVAECGRVDYTGTSSGSPDPNALADLCMRSHAGGTTNMRDLSCARRSKSSSLPKAWAKT